LDGADLGSGPPAKADSHSPDQPCYETHSRTSPWSLGARLSAGSGAARTGAYFATAPFIGALVAAIFFREHIAANVWLAGALMAVGVWLHLTESREQIETALKSVR